MFNGSTFLYKKMAAIVQSSKRPIVFVNETKGLFAKLYCCADVQQTGRNLNKSV